MPRSAQYTLQTLLDPAMAIVAEVGLGNFSLRLLAQKIDLSVSSITNLAGSKAQLLEGLIAAARQREADLLSPMRVLATRSVPLSPYGLAELADLALEYGALVASDLQVFFCEFIQASAAEPELARALQPWIDDQRAFWQQLSAATGHAHAELLGDALFALSVDERAHGAALQGTSAYRRLRRLCLIRLCSLDFCGRKEVEQLELFEHLVEQLGEVNDQIGIDRNTKIPTDAKFLKFANAAAHILVHEGARALTHRAVAARAAVPNSTLAYHFPTREDLVKGAIGIIILRLKRSVSTVGDDEPDGENAGVEIARSTFTLALEASRSPQYVGSAADMRRKRGENLVNVLNTHLPAGRKIDALTAQVLSVLRIGAYLADAHKGTEQSLQSSLSLMQRLLEL